MAKSPAMVTSDTAGRCLGQQVIPVGVDVLRSERGVYVTADLARTRKCLHPGSGRTGRFVPVQRVTDESGLCAFRTESIFRGHRPVFHSGDAGIPRTGFRVFLAAMPCRAGLGYNAGRSFVYAGRWRGPAELLPRLNEGATAWKTYVTLPYPAIHPRGSPGIWAVRSEVQLLSDEPEIGCGCSGFHTTTGLMKPGTTIWLYTGSLRYRLGAYSKLTLVSFTGAIPDAPRLDRMDYGF